MLTPYDLAQQRRERAARRAQDPRLTNAEAISATPLETTLVEIWLLPEAPAR